jgi:Protein of unknown function (DUF1579)
VGFRIHTDEPYGDERWIEIAPPDGRPLLVLASPADGRAPGEDRSELPDSPVLFTCDDIERTHRELTARGVRFVTPPTWMPFGWWAVFEDEEGTRFPGQNGSADGAHAGVSRSRSRRGPADLGVLLGRWRTRGSTIEGPTGPTARIDALDTYEWLPGRHALLHRVDARVGNRKIEGAEIIGYDPARRAYRSQYFGSEGPTAYDATLGDEDNGLLWRMWSDGTRFTGTFVDNMDAIVVTGSCSPKKAGVRGWM